jgi:hypothetical protein
MKQNLFLITGRTNKTKLTTEKFVLKYNLRNIIFGAMIYSSGDTLAACIMDDFSWNRLLGMMLVGATFYAFEIPNYFYWISKRTAMYSGTKASLIRTGLALIYFNPLWIARHMFFIKLFTSGMNDVNMNLMTAALMSFVVNIPVSFVANFLIQNKVPVGMRFIASAIFSAIMAVYYALSVTWF